MPTSRYILIATLGASIFLQACYKKGCTDPSAANYDDNAQKDDGSCQYEVLSNEQKNNYRRNYADLAFAMYEDAHDAAVALQSTIKQFTAAPSAAGLEACKNTWILARIPFSQSEALRFPESPIEQNDLFQRVNAWRINPEYIDYTEAFPNGGIISDTANHPIISRSVVSELNQVGANQNITLGYHVIEFLLWGEDTSDVTSQQPGKRTYKDYEQGPSQPFAKRRAQFLEACVDELVDDLAYLSNQWSAFGNQNYWDDFIYMNPRKATRFAITGLVLFGEFRLAAERMEDAMNNGLYGDEESRFSDNTHRDIYYNVLGMKALFDGKYGRADSSYVEGTSLFEVIFEHDPQRALEMKALSDQLVLSAFTIPDPYDYNASLEFESRTGPVSSMIQALKDYGEEMTDLSVEMQMGIEKDLPDGN